jgi:trans-aconitate 2-methyltransferase
VGPVQTPADWDPGQYRKFAAERSKPFWDLVGLIETDRPIGRAVDLGCGDGALTAHAADRLRIGEMLGIDDSPAMLADAAPHARPGVRFELGDIGAWGADHPGHRNAHDLVLANASLQWVPGHPRVLARWAAALAPHGQLAVQVPTNADHPSHLLVEEVAATEPFASAFDGPPPPDQVAANVLVPEHYATLLHELGFAEQVVRLEVYGHVLDSTAAVVEWVRGTTLTRFFKRLPTELHEPFVDAYRNALLARLGEQAPYFYPFKRILMWGRRQGSWS